MTTITCGRNQVEVTDVEEIGGYINENIEGDDVLYRDKEGQYYLHRTRRRALPRNAKYTMPHDRVWYERQTQPKVVVRRISAIGAMLWYVDAFVNDPLLAKQLRDAIIGARHAAEIIPLLKPEVLRAA